MAIPATRFLGVSIVSSSEADQERRIRLSKRFDSKRFDED